MHTVVVRILQQPDMVKKLEAIGMTNFTSASPEAFTAMVREEMAHWAQVVKAAGISAE
jgi:tripartite-type tricarboxylate transporter receptor subunit TctC